MGPRSTAQSRSQGDESRDVRCNYHMSKEGNYTAIQGANKQSHRRIKETGVRDKGRYCLLGNGGECLGKTGVWRRNEVTEEHYEPC